MSKARIAMALITSSITLVTMAGCGPGNQKSTDSGFSQLSINTDSSSLKQALNLDIQALQNPESMGQALTQAFALASDRAMPSAVIPRTDCGSVSGNTADTDHDQIPVLATYSYSACPISAGTYSASITIKDSDPANAASGFTAQLSGLTYLGNDNVKLVAGRTLNLSPSAGIYAVSSGMNLTRTEGLDTFTLSSQLSGMYAPDGTVTPWISGTIQLAGTVTMSKSKTSQTGLKVEINALHITSSCAAGPDAGEVIYTDTNNKRLILTYKSCGVSTTTYNGFQVGS